MRCVAQMFAGISMLKSGPWQVVAKPALKDGRLFDMPELTEEQIKRLWHLANAGEFTDGWVLGVGDRQALRALLAERASLARKQRDKFADDIHALREKQREALNLVHNKWSDVIIWQSFWDELRAALDETPEKESK